MTWFCQRKTFPSCKWLYERTFCFLRRQRELDADVILYLVPWLIGKVGDLLSFLLLYQRSIVEYWKLWAQCLVSSCGYTLMAFPMIFATRSCHRYFWVAEACLAFSFFNKRCRIGNLNGSSPFVNYYERIDSLMQRLLIAREGPLKWRTDRATCWKVQLP